MIQGDTVRLKVNFRDLNGDTPPVQSCNLTIYRQSDQSVITTYDNSLINMDKLGVFWFDYVANEPFIYEFKTIYKERPIVARGSIDVTFV